MMHSVCLNSCVVVFFILKRIKTVDGQPQVADYALCAKKLKQDPDVMKVPQPKVPQPKQPRPKRPPNVGDPLVPEGPSPKEIKLLRKLEAQG